MGVVWDKSPRALLPTLLASVDVIPFLEASLEHFFCCPASLSRVAPDCVVPTSALASSSFFSIQLWCRCSCLVVRSGYLDACALSVGYFAIVVAWVDTLSPMSLSSPHSGRCFAVECVVARRLRMLSRVFTLAYTLPPCCSGGYFAAVVSSLLGGCYATGASSPLLAPLHLCIFTLQV